MMICPIELDHIENFQTSLLSSCFNNSSTIKNSGTILDIRLPGVSGPPAAWPPAETATPAVGLSGINNIMNVRNSQHCDCLE